MTGVPPSSLETSLEANDDPDDAANGVELTEMEIGARTCHSEWNAHHRSLLCFQFSSAIRDHSSRLGAPAFEAR